VVVPLLDRDPLSYLRTGATGSTIFAVAWALLGVANFLQRRQREVRRQPLLRQLGE
jgi:hypothetical protein